MAILSKIREKSVFLIVVVGLALFAFVLDPSTLQDFFSSSKVNEVGEVNGESISRQEYAEAVDNYKTRTQNRVSDMQAGKTVWDNLLRERIYTYQLEEAGVTIGENDIWNKIISSRFVAESPQFQNELGLFDEDKFKLFLKELQESEDAQQQRLWISWKDYMDELAIELKRDTYNNLVNAGLGASLNEGKAQYEEDNTLISADFVYVPYNTIPDSIVKVTKSEISAYIEKYPASFQADATRDLTFVKFDIKATDADKTAIKNGVAKYMNDGTDERGDAFVGFKNTTDYLTFFDDFESDIPYREGYLMKAQLPSIITEDVLKSEVGDVFGPFEEGNFFKTAKVTEIVKRPDSVRSSHILIPFVGSGSADATTTKTEEQAKKSADSILKLVRRNKKKFAEVADELNKDPRTGKGGDLNWITHAQAFSGRQDNNFAKFIFDNKQGDIDVVQTQAGFHVLRIDEQKNKQNAYKVVTFGKQILPSQETENEIFQEVEKFALDVANKENNFYDVAREKGYRTMPAIGLKVLDDRIPSLQGTNRQIVTWAFDKESNPGDFKRFDIDKGYVVALLTARNEGGLMSAARATNRVRPILLNEKKAKLIGEKMSGASLNDIGVANKQTVRKMNGVALKSPSITGVGSEPKVVGAMYYAKENELYNKVAGRSGVFAFVITKKEKPAVLPNYETYRQQLATDRKNKVVSLFESLKKASDVEDNRAFFYGVNE